MRTISKPILAVVVIILAVLAAVILCLNLYLRAPGTQRQLTESLILAAGVPVTIESSYVLPLPPLGGVRLSGIKAQLQGRPTLFTADSITLRPDVAELLHGRLRIAGAVLNHPVLHLSLGELSSAQRLEASRTSSFGSAAGSAISNPIPGGTGSPGSSITTGSALAPASPQTTPVIKPATASDFPLRNVIIKNGEFTLLDDRSIPLISVSDLHLQGEHDVTQGWVGTLRSTQAVLSDRVIIKDLQSPVRLTENLKALSLEPFTALLGEGRLTGSAIFDLSMGAPRYTLAMNLAGASLKHLLADASYGISTAEGMISGDLQLTGTAGEGASIEGKGGLTAKDATIQPVDFLKQIGQLLNVEELKLLRLSESKCLFHLIAGRVVVDDLFLRSENLILSAKGPLKPTGELDLDSRLLFNDKLTGRLRGLLGSQLTPAPEPGYSQVSFHVSGSPMNPKTDLLERLTGFKIGGDLGGILQGLFGKPAPAPQPPSPPSPAR